MIKAFTAIIHANNRPPQPLNGRLVLTEATTCAHLQVNRTRIV